MIYIYLDVYRYVVCCGIDNGKEQQLLVAHITKLKFVDDSGKLLSSLRNIRRNYFR